MVVFRHLGLHQPPRRSDRHRLRLRPPFPRTGFQGVVSRPRRLHRTAVTCAALPSAALSTVAGSPACWIWKTSADAGVVGRLSVAQSAVWAEKPGQPYFIGNIFKIALALFWSVIGHVVMRGLTGHYSISNQAEKPSRVRAPRFRPRLRWSGTPICRLSALRCWPLAGSTVSQPPADVVSSSTPTCEKPCSLNRGTQSSLSDLLLLDLGLARRAADVVEVSNYVAALEHGLQRMKDGFPLAELLREIHGVLPPKAAAAKRPASSHLANWIGGSRPARPVMSAPPDEVPRA